MTVTVSTFVVMFFERILLMEVSRKKTNVVASSPAIAVAIAHRVKDTIVKPAFHVKLLCGDLVGGARRSTQQHQKRLGACNWMRPQFPRWATMGTTLSSTKL